MVIVGMARHRNWLHPEWGLASAQRGSLGLFSLLKCRWHWHQLGLRSPVATVGKSEFYAWSVGEVTQTDGVGS